MLEWLKDILGDGYTEEIDKQVSNEIGKAYAPRADLDSANEAKAAAEAQLADANKTIAGYKDMDIDAIRQSAADWQTKAEQAQKDADARVAAVQFDARLDGAIGKRRGRSPKAIKALLDMDALRGSKNQDQDIDAALDALQKDSGYLFEPVETPPPYAAGTGTARPPTAMWPCAVRWACLTRRPIRNKEEKTYGKCNRTGKELCAAAG